MGKWIRTWSVPVSLKTGLDGHFPGLPVKRGRTVPWQIHSLQQTSGPPLLGHVNQHLSVHWRSVHCRNINSVIKDETVFSTLTAKKPVSLYTVHDGAVHTVQRSPFYKDIILTIGGWNVAIWKEGVMVNCLQNGRVALRFLLLRKAMGTTDCSDITVPLGHFLEKLEQMA